MLNPVYICILTDVHRKKKKKCTKEDLSCCFNPRAHVSAKMSPKTLKLIHTQFLEMIK